MNVFLDTNIVLDVLADSIQFFSAIHARADCLVTRDTGHFPRSTLPVLSPAEFLQTHFGHWID